jgi:hypothetical protein
VINEAAPQAEPDPDATAAAEPAPAAADTAAAVERLFGEYHFPAGPRRILLAAAGVREARFPRHTTGTRCPGRAEPAALYFYFRSREVLYQIATSALDFTIEVAATEAKGPGSYRAPDEPRPSLTIWHTYSQVAHVVLYQTGALTTGHLADIAAKQRGQPNRPQVITDGVKSGDFDARCCRNHSGLSYASTWPAGTVGYRLTPQQLGDFNASPPSASLADTRRRDLPRSPMTAICADGRRAAIALE